MLKFLNGRLLTTAIEGAEGAVGAGGDAAAAAAAAAGSKPWYDGAPAEDVGYFQNRGWDKVDAKTAALNAAKAHREAEKLIGAPANELLRLPKDPNDTEAMRQVRIRLGMPKDESGYAESLKVVKHADGSDLKPEEVAAWSKKALSLGLRPADALVLVSESVKEADNAGSAGKTEQEGKLAAQKSALATNWGANFDANMFVAKQAAGALNVAPEALAALEKVIGYDKVMEMFRNIGTKIGEDRFVLNPHQPNAGAMTKEQAVDRKASLMKDTAWVQRYNSGDTTAYQEMLALNTMIVGR